VNKSVRLSPLRLRQDLPVALVDGDQSRLAAEDHEQPMCAQLSFTRLTGAKKFAAMSAALSTLLQIFEDLRERLRLELT
jgi:hypothetical protein